MHQAHRMFGSATLRLNPWSGLRPWQLLGVVLTLPCSPSYRISCLCSCPNVGSRQSTELRYHLTVVFPYFGGPGKPTRKSTQFGSERSSFSSESELCWSSWAIRYVWNSLYSCSARRSMYCVDMFPKIMLQGVGGGGWGGREHETRDHTHTHICTYEISLSLYIYI